MNGLQGAIDPHEIEIKMFCICAYIHYQSFYQILKGISGPKRLKANAIKQWQANFSVKSQKWLYMGHNSSVVRLLCKNLWTNEFGRDSIKHSLPSRHGHVWPSSHSLLTLAREEILVLNGKLYYKALEIPSNSFLHSFVLIHPIYCRNTCWALFCARYYAKYNREQEEEDTVVALKDSTA